MPKSNGEWWRAKLEANRQRDARSDDALRSAGWEVVVVWEHEDVVIAADRIEATLDERLGFSSRSR
jgi:DNA mismatch endonuclease (patch repair protein)